MVGGVGTQSTAEGPFASRREPGVRSAVRPTPALTLRSFTGRHSCLCLKTAFTVNPGELATANVPGAKGRHRSSPLGLTVPSEKGRALEKRRSSSFVYGWPRGAQGPGARLLRIRFLPAGLFQPCDRPSRRSPGSLPGARMRGRSRPFRQAASPRPTKGCQGQCPHLLWHLPVATGPSWGAPRPG